jgi:hypothetical protein
MLAWFSKRSLMWTVPAMALVCVTASPLLAQRLAAMSPRTTSAPKVSAPKPGTAARRTATKHTDAKRVNILSVKSMKAHLLRLREIARQNHIERAKQTSDPDIDEKNELVAKQLHALPGYPTRAATAGEQDEDAQLKEWEAQAEFYEAQLYYLFPRAFPHDHMDISAFARAAAKRDALNATVTPTAPAARAPGALAVVPVTPPAQKPAAVATNPVWTNIHPNQRESPPGYNGQTESWRVSGLTYDPNIPNRYYCAGSRGGVWQSNDAGQSWTPLIDSQPLIGASCVTVDRRDSNTIMIGTGEYDTSYPGIGVLKGHFDGVQWTFVQKGVALFGNAAIHHILQHPNIPSKFLATAGTRGLFMSLDSGDTWTEVLGPEVGAVTASFTNVLSNSTGTVLYAAADAPNGGVWQSADSGFTWTKTGAPSPATRIDIASSPQTTGRGERTLYAVLATEKQVFKGSPPGTDGNPPDDKDRGAMQWVSCANFPKDPADTHASSGARSIWAQSTFYNLSIACTAIPATSQFGSVRTTDDATPIPHFGTYTRDIVVVGMLNLHVSLDGGLLWRSASGDGIVDYPYNSGVTKGVFWDATLAQVPDYHSDQHALAINPKNPLEFLAGSDGGAYRIAITPNNEPGGALGGLHFLIPVPVPVMPTRPDTPNTTPPPWFASIHDRELFVGPNNVFDFFFLPNYNDAPGPPTSATQKPLAGYSLTSINAGLGIAQFYTNAYHPTNPQTAIGGTQDNGTQYSFGSFTGWNNVFGGDGGATGINQTNPAVSYASNFNPKVIDPLAPPIYDFGRTTTGWFGSSNINLLLSGDLMPFILTGGMSRSKQNIFYAATNYLYQFDETTFPGSGTGTIDQPDPFGGNPATYSLNWKKFRQIFSQNAIVSAVATSASPNTSQYLAVGTQDGTVWFSTNANQNPDPELVNFTEIDNEGKPGGLPQRSIGGISISPVNPKSLFVVLQGTGSSHVWRCADVTKINPQWVDIGGPLPDISTNCIEVFPRNNDQEIAIGTDVGAFYTSNGGTTWHNITVPLGLPNAQVNTMTFVPGTKFLNAGTFGRGIWHIDLTNPLTVFSGAGGGGPIIPPPVITIAPYLDAYVGVRSSIRMTVQVFQGTTLVLNQTLPLSAAGYATVTLPSVGTFDVLVSINGFLHRRLKNQVFKVDTTVRPQMVNGDVNHDNAITQADLTQAQRKLGQFTVGPEDVNGNGSVTQADLDIITKSLGQVGDN